MPLLMQRGGIQGIQLTAPSPKYTGGIQGVYRGYTASIQVLGYTGVYRWARHPHHIKLGVYRGYTAQKVYRCIQVSSLGKGGVYTGGYTGYTATPLQGGLPEDRH